MDRLQATVALRDDELSNLASEELLSELKDWLRMLLSVDTVAAMPLMEDPLHPMVHAFIPTASSKSLAATVASPNWQMRLSDRMPNQRQRLIPYVVDDMYVCEVEGRITLANKASSRRSGGRENHGG